jgi:hypothetical protein
MLGAIALDCIVKRYQVATVRVDGFLGVVVVELALENEDG